MIPVETMYAPLFIGTERFCPAAFQQYAPPGLLYPRPAKLRSISRLTSRLAMSSRLS